jgi:hypothetical protein
MTDSLLPLLVGVILGLGALLALALFYGRRGADRAWRGCANAMAVGITLGALFDLLPKALEQATLLIGFLLRTGVMERFDLAPDSFFGIGALLLTQAVVPIGALSVLFLYLTGNTMPMVINGQVVGGHTTGWRSQLLIPEAGAVDWRGIALLTVGLAAQNLWLGQVRGVLTAPEVSGFNLFLYGIALIGTLRGLALIGPFVDPARRWLAFGSCALVIGCAVVFAVLNPWTRDSIILGIVPVFVGVVLLPVAMGRLLRAVQNDIGLHWQTTLVVIAALAVERASSYLILMLAQGQIG